MSEEKGTLREAEVGTIKFLILVVIFIYIFKVDVITNKECKKKMADRFNVGATHICTYKKGISYYTDPPCLDSRR